MADKYIIGLYQEMEDYVIADIARRVKKMSRYTESAELMAKFMVEQGYSAKKIRAEVMKKLKADKEYQKALAENTKAYKQEIQNIIEETVEKAKQAGKTLIAEAGNMAWNNDLSMWEQQGVDLSKPNTMAQLIKAFQKQTTGELKNLTGSMGFKGTVLGTTGILAAFQHEMDRATLMVSVGVISYDEAIKDCVHRLAQSGLRTIDYASGRSYQLDTAARMCVRTGMSQLAGRIMEENLKSTGQDLVITSQHIGSRPEHVPWQNKVFSYSGKNKKYPDFRKSTGYGTVEGLKGANCTHDFFPFFEGSSIIPEDVQEPAPVRVNGKEYTYYQATQQQRKMERGIRATKREIEATRAIDGDVTELKKSLRNQTKEYMKFSEAAKLRPKENRLRVESGTSNLKKTKAWKTQNGAGISDMKEKKPEYRIRKHTGAENIENELAIVNDVISQMPIKVQESINSGTIIDVGKIGASQYDYEHDILYVSSGASMDAVVHEIGHMVENRLFDSARVQKMKVDLLSEAVPNDIIVETYYDASGRPIDIFLLDSDKLVSEYQGRLYADDWSDIYDENWNIKPELLAEYIAEPFRMYILEPDLLKKKAPELYKVIKEAVE